MRLLFILLFPFFVLAQNTERIIPDSNHKILKITEEGPSKQNLFFKRADGLLFIYNETNHFLININVNYGQQQTHCASSNLKIENGFVATKEPLGPKDFTVFCFPNAGEYVYQITGVPGKNFSGTFFVK